MSVFVAIPCVLQSLIALLERSDDVVIQVNNQSVNGNSNCGRSTVTRQRRQKTDSIYHDAEYPPSKLKIHNARDESARADAGHGQPEYDEYCDRRRPLWLDGNHHWTANTGD
jgi:hypothetical protein